MKAIVLLLSLLLPVSGICSPFLVCDRAPDDQEVSSYIIYANGVQVATALVSQDPQYGFMYDLQGADTGKITFTATATNIRGTSDQSDPFVLPAAVSIPAGMKLIP
jgi:hypothetical protein